jgi:hypothetical protein
LQVLLARLQFFQFHKACFLFIRYCGELRGEGAAPKTNSYRRTKAVRATWGYPSARGLLLPLILSPWPKNHGALSLARKEQ